MGRPLNKKYFGNRNIGSTSTTADDGIGGKGVASIPITTASTYTTRPTITFSGGTKVISNKGVAATATITSEADTGVATAGGSGYVVGDLITLTTAGGSAIAYVASLTGSAIATVNFTGTGASRGSFEALPGAAISATGGSGNGATVTITFRAKSVVITDPGSGYKTAPTASATQSVVLGTVVMTTPVANANTAGSAANPFPAIIGYSYTGGSLKATDIIKQSGSRKYTIQTSDGITTGAMLVTTTATTATELNIIATDSSNNTYFVKKIQSRTAILVRKQLVGASYEFADGAKVAWVLGSPTLKTNVQIENA